MTVTIPLPWDKPPLSQNDRWVASPYAKAGKVSTALRQARLAVAVARVDPLPAAHVTLHYRLPTWHRRDADNMAPVLKVVQDALVLEGVLPDDSFRHVPRSGQHIHPPIRGNPPAMWVELEPTQEVTRDD